MTFNLQEVARAMRAEGDAGRVEVSGWSVDTRTQNAGDYTLRLRGPNHDGHDFTAAAIEKGAAAVVVERHATAALERRTGACRELLVKDTLQALADLAAWARLHWGGDVIGVTGSAGKTTTKDAIAHLLAIEMPVGKTCGNFNNQGGRTALDFALAG